LLLIGAVFQRQDYLVQTAAELGLNPGHMKALILLDPAHPAPMRSLSDALMCDASMATWLVDRLEEQRLVERKASTSDRRVKTVALTQKGVAARKQIEAKLLEPPPEFDALTPEDLAGLMRALRKLRTTDAPITLEGLLRPARRAPIRQGD